MVLLPLAIEPLITISMPALWWGPGRCNAPATVLPPRRDQADAFELPAGGGCLRTHSPGGHRHDIDHAIPLVRPRRRGSRDVLHVDLPGQPHRSDRAFDWRPPE